jgi:hypothetical protein
MRTKKELLIQTAIEIDKRADGLIKSIEMSRLAVNEHCLDLARQIDIEAETKIEKLDETGMNKLNDQRREYLKRIKDYEDECFGHLEATKAILMASISSESKQLAQRLRDFQENFDFDLAEELEQQSKKQLLYLKTLDQQLKGFQFAGKLMIFKERDSHSPFAEYAIGSLEIEKLEIPSILQRYFKQNPSRSGFPSISLYFLSISFRATIKNAIFFPNK